MRRSRENKLSRGKRVTLAGANEAKLSPENVAAAIRFGIRQFIDASATLELLGENSELSSPQRALVKKAKEQIDDTFAIALREATMVRHLAKTTESTELLFGAVSEALHAADDLPELLRLSERFLEPSDLNSSSSDTFYFHFAETVIGLVKHLERLCTKHPERFRLLARELPYWPMLVFRHKAANNHLFEKSADGQRPLAEMLELGTDCPINISNRANYSLKTPINSFLWEILSELHWGRGWVGSIHDGKIGRDDAAQTDIELMCKKTGISEAEAAIHIRASGLPALDKRNSDQWVDEIIMPWIRLKYPDLRNVAAFACVDTGPSGRRYAAARKVVLAAFHNLARPADVRSA